MSHHYKRDGDIRRPVDPLSIDIVNVLEPATYVVQCDQLGFFLRKVDSFTLPSRLYGDTIRHADRIFSTFIARPGMTGALLTGEKGSGKTLLAKKLGLMALEANMPVLLVNAPFIGDEFNAFLQGITQPCMVLFDEYEKVYDRDRQTKLLTLMDGTMSSHKLFVLTCNDRYRVDSHMRNRPGRLFYSLNFEGLSKEFVEEYCDEKLEDKTQTPEVVAIASMFSAFNFDMLQAIVEEMNRYNEPASVVMELLNVRPGLEDNVSYSATLLYKGVPIKEVPVAAHAIQDNPLSRDSGRAIGFRIPATVPKEILQALGAIDGEINDALENEDYLRARIENKYTWNFYPEITRDLFVGHHNGALIFDVRDAPSELAIALTKDARRNYGYYAF